MRRWPGLAQLRLLHRLLMDLLVRLLTHTYVCTCVVRSYVCVSGIHHTDGSGNDGGIMWKDSEIHC